MAASLARHGYTTKLLTGVVGATQAQMTAIAEVRSIDAPECDVSVGDITHLQSDSAFKEKLPGFIDGGEVPLTLNFLETEMNTQFTALRSKKDWIIQFPLEGVQVQAALIRFRGFVSKLKMASVPEDGPILWNFTIAVDGPITFTPGS